jgi:two-component system sensor histidine kinase BarA
MSILSFSNEANMEMIELLVKTLPTDFSEIKRLKDSNDHPELLKQVHRLHGAVCYCDVPPLRKAIYAFETALKQNNLDEVPTLFSAFETEIDKVIKQYS